LTVSVPATATEGDGMLVNQGLITVSEAPTSDVTIELNSNDTSEVTVPQTVTLLAGQTTAAFSLTVFDDNEIDNLQ